MAKTSPRTSTVSVLLVEDDEPYARLIENILSRDTTSRELVPAISLRWADRLRSALTQLADGRVDVVLLDLLLPDSNGLNTLKAVLSEHPHVPVVVLTGLADEGLAVKALQAGAQDYLVKSDIDTHLLVRALRYALERHRLQEQLRNLSLTDGLTGLYNRRAFLALAERHLKLARRRKKHALLLLADMDNLKRINDRHGHLEGDRALVKFGQVLLRSFRDADIIARLGGDEFAVLALDVEPGQETVVLARLERNLRKVNAQAGRAYSIGVSFGSTHVMPGETLALEQLLERADADLYRAKALKPMTGSSAPAAERA